MSVADYHDLGERGILTPDDRVELIDGYLVIKPMHNSRGASTVVRVARYLDRATPPGFVVRSQVPITLEFGEPEPDAVVARGDLRTYDRHHPMRTPRRRRKRWPRSSWPRRKRCSSRPRLT